MVWIWQHDKKTDDYKIILNCVRKLMKNKVEKEARKGPDFKKDLILKIICKKLYNGGKSAARFYCKVAALVPDMFCDFYLAKNHKIIKNSAITETREKISTYLESLEF
jgi:hypothetical protein